VRVAKDAQKGAEKVSEKATRAPKKAPVEKAKRVPRKPKVVEQAIKAATVEAVEPSDGGRRRRRTRSGAPPAEPVNEPLTFVTFIAEHHPGTVVTGEVESFSSHGAFVRVGMARCYIALTDMSDPSPAAARQMLHRGEQRRFLVKAFDAPRRGIELSLIGVPEDDEVVAAPPAAPAKQARTRKAATKQAAVATPIEQTVEPKKSAKRATAAKPAPAKKAATKRTTAPKKQPASKKAAATKKPTVAKKATATKKTAVAKKATATKKPAVTKKAAPAKKAGKAAKKRAKKSGR
jgi:hypothetical protein